jgi:AraC family transcriptional regulator, arabinose operon regulatory protein
MDTKDAFLYKTYMNYYDDLSFFRFNHLPDHYESGERVFVTHALNFLARGSIRWCMEGHEERILTAPTAYWTWPGPRFHYGNILGQTWEHYFVSFTGARTMRWCKTGFFVANESLLPIRTITSPERFRAAFEDLLALLARHPTGTSEAVWRLEGLLLQLHNQPAPEAAFHPRRAEVMELATRIEESPEEAYDFLEEAEALAMTPAHLRRLFHLFIGSPPVAFVNRCRLSRAALRLRTTGTPVKQIAEESGFKDLFYFTKRFAREHKLPPATYRKAFQQSE